MRAQDISVAQTARLESLLLLMAIVGLALFVRLAVIDASIGLHTDAAAEPSADSRIHIALVQNLLAGRGYSLNGPTAITPPLYVFYLAAVYRLFDDPAAVRLVQAVMGAAGCVLIFFAGVPLVGHRAAMGGALLLAAFPLPVFIAGLHLTENLFLILLLLVIWQAARLMEQPTLAGAGGLGALVGLAALTRAVFLGILPFLLIWMAALWRKRPHQAIALFALTVVTAAAVIAPWTIRNYTVLGAFVPVQSNGGMVFWAGNNPVADGGIAWPTQSTWSATPPPDDGAYGWRHLSVGEENALYLRTALAWMRAHPGDYGRLLVRKIVRFYGLTRAEDEANLDVAFPVRIFHRAVLLVALVGLVLSARVWRLVSILFVLMAFSHAAALLFSGATRYLVPMVPSLMLFGGVALSRAWGTVTGSAR